MLSGSNPNSGLSQQEISVSMDVLTVTIAEKFLRLQTERAEINLHLAEYNLAEQMILSLEERLCEIETQLAYLTSTYPNLSLVAAARLAMSRS